MLSSAESLPDEPALVHTAVEELLRKFGVPMPARTAARDFEFGGEGLGGSGAFGLGGQFKQGGQRREERAPVLGAGHDGGDQDVLELHGAALTAPATSTAASGPFSR